jgi:hypothetical protein
MRRAHRQTKHRAARHGLAYRAAWLGCAGAALGLFGCSDGSSNVLGGVPAIAYISQDSIEPGNVFDYQNGGRHGNIFTLTPPTASGAKQNLTNWADASINAMDVSFDAREIVFSARAPGDDNYHVYRVNVDGSNPCDAAAGKATMGACQITDGPFDEVYPIYLPAGRIFYMTNKNVEGPEVPQFADEYERATTAQAAHMNIDGSEQELGPRNVSHRVSPSLLPDGRIMTTEWRHLGMVNDGDLITMNQDLTGVREGFGREETKITNSHLRATYAGEGKVVAIGTSRDRTFQAGKVLLIDLGGKTIAEQSEARASVVDLTPDVPGDRSPSFKGVGRYYDARVLDLSKNTFLVSWSDGQVETEVLSAAKASPDFGIYLYDAEAKTRAPIVNEVGTWEFSPRALVKRDEPPALKNVFAAATDQYGATIKSTLISALNVNDSTMFKLTAGQAVKVRLSEGFSAEEGAPNMFGLTEFDGMSLLGEADVQPDGSYKAVVPPNIPIRQQLIDKYGMALGTSGAGGSTASEPLWMQGRPGEARVCGGCHEDRTKSIQLTPGSSALQAIGAAQLDFPTLTRQQRRSEVYTPDVVKGVPWDKALQPIFDAKCVSCHNGVPGPANPSYSVTFGDMTTLMWTFDLSGRMVDVMVEDSTYTYSASHVSLLGPEMLLRERVIAMQTGELKSYVEPGAAHESALIQMLNPPRRYPTVDTNDRAFAGKPIHPLDVGGTDLTPDEYYLLILMADNGGQYYSRENIKGY